MTPPSKIKTLILTLTLAASALLLYLLVTEIISHGNTSIKTFRLIQQSNSYTTVGCINIQRYSDANGNEVGLVDWSNDSSPEDLWIVQSHARIIGHMPVTDKSGGKLARGVIVKWLRDPYPWGCGKVAVLWKEGGILYCIGGASLQLVQEFERYYHSKDFKGSG